MDANETLNDIQKLALKKANLKAKIHAKNLVYQIEQQFIEHDIDRSYINKIVNYIKNNTFITTMIPLRALQGLLINPYLKNLFEIQPDNNGGSVRVSVENLLFHKVYNNCQPKDRPKYGSVNLYDNISGDKTCSAYGNICIKYKNSIKERTTFIYCDSFHKQQYICTFDNCDHILYHFTPPIVKLFIKLIESNQHIDMPTYIEAQIHGTVDISKDVESISIPQKIYNENQELIHNFRDKYQTIDILIY